MAKILQWEVILLTEIIKYLLGYSINSKKEIEITKMKMIIVIFSMIVIIPLIFTVTIKNGYIIMVWIAMGVLLVFIDDKKNCIWQYIVTFLSITALDAVMEMCTNRIIINIDSIASEIIIIIWDFCVLLCLLFFLFIISIKRIGRKINDKFSLQLLKVSLLIVGISLCISGEMEYKISETWDIYFILGTLSFFGLILLDKQISYVLEVVKSLNERIFQKEIMRAVQKEYYLSLLRNENEIRKYRHDMINHFLVLESLIGNNQVDKAKKYLTELKGDFDLSSQKKYVIGNDTIDAITGYYVLTIEEYTNIKISGNVPKELNISQLSLCTIYSNLLSNAVEEIQRQKKIDVKDLKLEISFSVGKYFFQLYMRNTALYNNNFDGINTKTTKADCKNHGIGLKSILNEVEKLNGRMSLTQIDGCVVAEVNIPTGNILLC